MKERRKQFFKRTLSGLLAVTLSVSGITWWNGDQKVEAAEKATLTVDMTTEKHEIIHGAAGFLYGISNEDVPTTNTMTPLKPKILATKGALGTEHPYGDALDVAKTFLESGGEQVQMYNSNYYGVFGVSANYLDYSEVLETILAPAVVEWKEAWTLEHGTPEEPKDNIGARINIDEAIVYIPINEGTPINGTNFNIAWKSYYEAIKKADPKAYIAGPNSCGYNLQFGAGVDMRSHFQYCVDNDCMPDVVTWHELEKPQLAGMKEHMEDFKDIWKNLNWGSKTPQEMPQIVINEYAEMIDCGVPGRLVNWIGRLEDEQIYGCLPFWHQANNLNDLTADANEGNGAWWVYKWYGDMSGMTLDLTSNTNYDLLYGVASIDDNKKSASVLLGGVDGEADVVLENVSETNSFKDAEKVHIQVQASYFTGFHGAQTEPLTVLEGVYPVDDNGQVVIPLENMKFSTAYFATITEAGEEEQVTESLVNPYHQAYEAERASFTGTITNHYSINPVYYFSDENAVKLDKDKELTYTFEVPIDGKYKLDFIYGNGTGSNRNNMSNHAPKNIEQMMSLDGTVLGTEMMKSTLLSNMTSMDTKYLDLTAGTHTITLKTVGNGTIYHDVMYVTYSGAMNEDVKAFHSTYEAEQADFNAFVIEENGKSVETSTTVSTKNEIGDYSGNGYVTGLSAQSVPKGGGIRWNVIVEKSGLYQVSFRYQSGKAGELNLYVGNTASTLDQLVKSLPIQGTKNQWETVTATIYLQKGINIVDVDTTVDAALDYMRVQEILEKNHNGEALAKTIIIEAEDAIPEKAKDLIQVSESTGASGNTYVKGLAGSETSSDTLGNYLEFEVYAPEAGTYQMQVFQSNDEICGSHTYNTKIIDKYATFEVRNSYDQITSQNRYFFINTFSVDTFKEKTIPIRLAVGKNVIRVYNDDSWNVLWGGTTGTPGENKLDNYTPNFDKFVILPNTLNDAAALADSYDLSIRTTKGGHASANKNHIVAGGACEIIMIPEEGIEQVFINGENKTSDVRLDAEGNYTISIQQIQEDQEVLIYFTNDYQPDGDIEGELLYFVDAGDHRPSTVSDGESFGTYNSVTDQLFGVDAKANKSWGLYDHLDLEGNNSNVGNLDSEGAFTQYTWANERNLGDNQKKRESFRYARSQDGSDVVRDQVGELYIDYKFQLDPNQQVAVEVGVGNEWGNSSPVNIYANRGVGSAISENQGEIIAQNAVAPGVVTGVVSADQDGWLTINVRRDLGNNRTINLNYIKILEYDETAAESPLKAIEIKSAPNQSDYAMNEELNLDGMEVSAVYENGSSRNLEVSNLFISGFFSYRTGVRKVMVGYSEKGITKTDSFEVTVGTGTSEAVLEGIAITKMPDKTEYIQGEELELDGMEAKAVYDDGRTESVTITKEMISGFDSSGPGYKNLTLEYQGKKDVFLVTVKEASVSPLTLIAGANKTQYVVGTEGGFDEGSVVVHLLNSDGSLTPVEQYTLDMGGFDINKTGTYVITVKVNGYADASFPVTVEEASSLLGISVTLPKQTSYLIGEELNLDGMEVWGRYQDTFGIVQKIKLEESSYQVDSRSFDKNAAGEYTITVNYQEKNETYKASFTVKVIHDPEVLELLYFVDAGDHNPATVSTGDTFGKYSSVTDQVFGLDAKSGKSWGVYDHLDMTGNMSGAGSVNSKGAFTKYTWANELTLGDNQNKSSSFRYARNQDGSNEVSTQVGELYIDYKFELEPNQEVKVEVGVGNYWGNSSPVNVYVNRGIGNQLSQQPGQIIEENVKAPTEVSGYVQADEDGWLTVNVRRDRGSNRTINVNYIKISNYEVRLQEIKMLQKPNKVKYEYGEALDLRGLQVEAVYSDGSSKKVPVSALEITGYNAKQPGNQVITAAYTERYGEDTVTRKVTFSVEVEKAKVELDEEVKNVIDLINAIGTVTYSDASKAKIDAARLAYNKLTDSQKSQVTNYTVLEAAGKTYTDLKKAHDQKETVKKGQTYKIDKYKYKVTNVKKATVTVTGVTSKNLKTIKVRNTVKIAGKKFKVTAIGTSAFKNCKKATSAKVGKNVKTIGNQAFYGCKKMKKITINSTALKSIGNKTFYNCKKLKTITIKSKVLTKVGRNALKGIDGKAKIKVPANKVIKYQRYFKNKGQGKGVVIIK